MKKILILLLLFLLSLPFFVVANTNDTDGLTVGDVLGITPEDITTISLWMQHTGASMNLSEETEIVEFLSMPVTKAIESTVSNIPPTTLSISIRAYNKNISYGTRFGFFIVSNIYGEYVKTIMYRLSDEDIRSIVDRMPRRVLGGPNLPPQRNPNEIRVILIRSDRSDVRGIIQFDVPPIIVNNRVLVPFRAVFEALEMEVEWNDETRTAIGTNDDIRIEIPVDSYTAYINGEPVELDVPAMLYNARTLVPLRFIAESTGAGVWWSEIMQTVWISIN